MWYRPSFHKYDISFSCIYLLMIATIQSSKGITDLLTRIFTENITP